MWHPQGHLKYWRTRKSGEPKVFSDEISSSILKVVLARQLLTKTEETLILLQCEKTMRPFLTIHHPGTANAYYASGSWTTDTFYGLLVRHALDRPNSVALQDGRRSLTWAELRQWVD